MSEQSIFDLGDGNICSPDENGLYQGFYCSNEVGGVTEPEAIRQWLCGNLDGVKSSHPDWKYIERLVELASASPRQALGGDVEARAQAWLEAIREKFDEKAGAGGDELPKNEDEFAIFLAGTMATFAQSETTVLRQALGNLVTAINQAPAVQWANVEGIEAMKAAQNLLGENI